jgi:hypothetical protein
VTGNKEISGIISEKKCNFKKRIPLFDFTRIILASPRFVLVLTLDFWSTAFEEYGILKVSVIIDLTVSTRMSSIVRNEQIIDTTH